MTSRRPNKVHLFPSNVFLIAGTLPGTASEEQVPEEKNKLTDKISVHGFGSLGFLNSSNNNYLMESRGGSFDFNEIAFNAMFDVRDDLRVGAQIFVGDMGDYGNYEPRLDWGYVDWRPKNWLGIRGGKFKRPNGLYNETLDVDAARTFILLPQSVYSYQYRDFFLATTGVGGYGNVNLGSGGDVDYQIYYGLPNTDRADGGAGEERQAEDRSSQRINRSVSSAPASVCCGTLP